MTEVANNVERALFKISARLKRNPIALKDVGLVPGFHGIELVDSEFHLRSTAAEQQDIGRNDFGPIPLFTFCIVVRSGLDPALNADAISSRDEFVQRLSALSPYDHVMPIRSFFLLIIAIAIGFCCGYSHGEFGLTVRDVSQLGIAAKITD
jgi:hypothetical protein